MKRLPTSLDPETLIEKLQNLNFTITHVRQMMAPTQDPDGTHRRRPIPIWVVTLPNNENSQRIYQLKDIKQHLIQIESYKANPHVIQCHRRQKFGHTAKRSNLEIHCVKCGNNHIFAESPSKGPTHLLKCSNCQRQQTATYSQCPVQQTQRRALHQKNRERQANNNRVQHTNFHQQDSAFPALQQPRQTDLQTFQFLFDRPTEPQTSPHNESLTDSLKGILVLLRNINLKNILQSIHATLQRFAAANDPFTKILTLLEVFSNLINPTNGP